MVEFALVSLDEFEKIERKKMPELKSMMQTMKPSFIGAYKKNFSQSQGRGNVYEWSRAYPRVGQVLKEDNGRCDYQ